MHFFYAILAGLKFAVKACFFKQIFSRPNRRQSKIRVNQCNLCLKILRVHLWLNFSSTSDQRRDTTWAIRAGIKNTKSKILKNFSNSITLCLGMIYLLSVSSVFSVANVFFVPNAHLRPLIGTLFFCVSFGLYEVLFRTFRF